MQPLALPLPGSSQSSHLPDSIAANCMPSSAWQHPITRLDCCPSPLLALTVSPYLRVGHFQPTTVFGGSRLLCSFFSICLSLTRHSQLGMLWLMHFSWVHLAHKEPVDKSCFTMPAYLRVTETTKSIWQLNRNAICILPLFPFFRIWFFLD